MLRILIITICACNVGTQRGTRPNGLISYSIPETRPLKKALGYYEDTYLNFTELSSKHGYHTEQHTVTTEDGYVLTVFRILSTCGIETGYPVLLMHGIFDTSDVWIVAGKQRGLGYLLAQNCYDVWTPNHRGNKYSRRHIKLNPDKDVKFWNYSFDEHGNFDLPAVIDYILAVTRRQKINYIGHSQGTTDFLAMASLRPKYNDKIQVSILLAPVAWMSNIVSPIPKLLSHVTQQLKIFLDSAGYSELLASHQLTHLILEYLCQVSSDDLCSATLAATTGYKSGIPGKTLAIAFGHLLSGSSSKSIAHFGQLIQSKRFQRYDEGSTGNILRYGRTTAPEYNVSRITAPVVLITGRNDWLSSLKDIATLTSKLPNLLENFVVPEPGWSHHNHVWGKLAPGLVFLKIFEYLRWLN
ncbi:lipase 3-like [Amyelois transitella]|uniref:lipase 3-like n=1 Tax=Amyelois transitella TaxID=680683 RepID=UPI0029901DD5|nr:lipase 3-like [Amyelois transitella]